MRGAQRGRRWWGRAGEDSGLLVDLMLGDSARWSLG